MPYLAWLLVFAALPSVLLWLFEWRLLWRYRSVFAVVIAFALVLGIAWDIVAVRTRLWGWPDDCCVAWIWELPVEELLFMVFVPLLLASLTIVIRQITINHRKHRRRA